MNNVQRYTLARLKGRKALKAAFDRHSWIIAELQIRGRPIDATRVQWPDIGIMSIDPLPPCKCKWCVEERK